jgi:hypothetical protein
MKISKKNKVLSSPPKKIKSKSEVFGVKGIVIDTTDEAFAGGIVLDLTLKDK